MPPGREETWIPTELEMDVAGWREGLMRINSCSTHLAQLALIRLLVLEDVLEGFRVSPGPEAE